MADQTATDATGTLPTDSSPEAAAEAYLKQHGEAEAPAEPKKPKPQEPKEEIPAVEESAETTESDEEPQGEPTDEKPDDQPTLVEAEYEGKVYEVPKELKEALLRQADYSRKMGEVSAKAKSVDAQLEATKKMAENAEKIGNVRGELKAIDLQLKQYEGVDWQKLRQNDPQAYSLHALDFRALQDAKNTAVNQAKALEGEIEQESRKVFSERIAERDKACSKAIPGYREKVAIEIAQYALDNGYTADDLSGATFADARAVIALNKARLYDELVKGKDAVIAKAQKAQPVAKPGVPRGSSAKVADAMAVLRKTNTVEAAADAYLARQK